jgi:hypothetical protein
VTGTASGIGELTGRLNSGWIWSTCFSVFISMIYWNMVKDKKRE